MRNIYFPWEQKLEIQMYYTNLSFLSEDIYSGPKINKVTLKSQNKMLTKTSLNGKCPSNTIEAINVIILMCIFF